MFSFRDFLSITVFSFSINSFANQFYVSNAGSDSNPGTEALPYKTIQKAANSVTAGSTVHVAAGIYAETLVTTINGTSAARIRFVSDSKWKAIIVPTGSSYTMWSVNGGYTDIDGFQIDGSGSTTVRAGIYLNGGNSSVTNSLVQHVAEKSGCDNRGGAGLVADQGRGPSFQNYDFTNNVVHHVGAGCGWIQGIYHSSSGSISNNVVYATSQGINMGHDDHDINVMNNTLFGNSGYGVYFGGCKEAYNHGCPTSGIKIVNNIIYDNGGGVQGPITSEDVNNEVRNNLIYGNGNNFDLASPSNNTRTGEINAIPQFVIYNRDGGGDYHLKSTSPAIDKGLATNAPSKDIDGNARPQGAGIDIGAYEYGAIVAPAPTPAPAPAPAPTPAPAQVPIATLSTKIMTFAGQLIGTKSSIQYVTVTNTGSAPLLFSPLFGMTGDFDFGGSGTCAPDFAYQPGTSCTVSVVFIPTASGSRQGVLSITSNASATSMNVALSGSGVTSTVDTAAPVTTITGPTNLAPVAIRAYVTIKAQASDNVGVKSVQFFVNGVLRCTKTAAPYECVWKVPRQRGISYNLQTKALDAAGNSGSSKIVKVTAK